MCRVDPRLGVAVTLGNLILPDVLLRHGTEEQREKYIPPLCTGDAVSAVTSVNQNMEVTSSVWTQPL